MAVALRDALCSDDCRLELPPAKAFGDLSRRLADLFASWFGRSGVDDNRKDGAHPRIQPNAEEQLDRPCAAHGAARTASRAGLDRHRGPAAPDASPAPGASAYLKQGLDEQDLLRIAHLLDDQWHIASPPRGAFRPIRPPRDSSRWPSSSSGPGRTTSTRGRSASTRRARRATPPRPACARPQEGQGFGEAMLNFAEWQVRLPRAMCCAAWACCRWKR